MADDFDERPEPAFTVAELEEQIEEANVVLGVEDTDKCTYDSGYRPRQAVFACLTCTTDGAAGFCTACAMTCHDSHEVVELWTKRNFRCDCGNDKFGGFQCQLRPGKDPQNEKNEYNQNFKGIYCACHRPYPDPERTKTKAEAQGSGDDAEEEEEMTQCVVCEDWFHDEHLGQDPGDAAFEELICPECFESKCRFLHFYPHLVVRPGGASAASATQQEGPAAAGPFPAEARGAPESAATTTPHAAPAGVVDGQTAQGGGAASAETGAAHHTFPTDTAGGAPAVAERAGPTGAESAECTRCKLGRALEGQSLREAIALLNTDSVRVSILGHVGDQGRGPTVSESEAKPGGEQSPGAVTQHALLDCKSRWPPLFLRKDWRSELCTCNECASLYSDNKVPYLTEFSDTMRAHEEASKKKMKEMEDAAEKALEARWQELGHMGQVEVARGINELKTSFASFAEKLKGTDRVVTADDIRGVFEEAAKKRRRV